MLKADKAQGTLIRWVWSQLEPSYPRSYMLGTLAGSVEAADTAISISGIHPFPGALPAVIYIGQEQATASSVDGNTITVTRPAGVAHAVGVPVLTDAWHAVARDYCVGQRHNAPLHFGGYALCECELTNNQLEAAKQDPRLVVLPAIRSSARIPEVVAKALGDWGVTPDMTVYGMLETLAEREPAFLQED